MKNNSPSKHDATRLQRMHPMQRLLISVVLTLIAFIVIPKSSLSPLLFAMILWIVFSFAFNLTGWMVLFIRPIEQIKKVAVQDDGSKAFVFLMVVVSSFASLFTILLLLIDNSKKTAQPALFIPVAVVGMLMSWIMVHTLFAFHYAHMYYNDENEGDAKTSEGLDFPGDQAPDYLDFAYFSFVIGCTFQVSDVEVSSKKIRRMVFLHGLLSFALNTFVVALTINIIASLSN